MKWKALSIVASAALCLASTALAQQRLVVGPEAAPAPVVRRPIFNQISWWAKYGQPVESTVAPNGEPMVLHDHGHGFGYVYGMGSCDCRPPCTDQLWAGYVQNPWRCSHPQYHQRGNCAACGHISDCNCATPTATACGCSDAVGSCGCTDGACCSKCKHKKQWLAHWHWGKKKGCCDSCTSCSVPVSCADPAATAAPGGMAPLPPAPPGAVRLTPPTPLPSGDEASVLKRPLFRQASIGSGLR
ncbi:MAG TPA: hypothetical protein VFV87_06085 [Pirellulaceae bacterium]|nr:hypothetical protein [Pirellulaceae bacterium]